MCVYCSVFRLFSSLNFVLQNQSKGNVAIVAWVPGSVGSHGRYVEFKRGVIEAVLNLRKPANFSDRHTIHPAIGMTPHKEKSHKAPMVPSNIARLIRMFETGCHSKKKHDSESLSIDTCTWCCDDSEMMAWLLQETSADSKFSGTSSSSSSSSSNVTGNGPDASDVAAAPPADLCSLCLTSSHQTCAQKVAQILQQPKNSKCEQTVRKSCAGNAHNSLILPHSCFHGTVCAVCMFFLAT